jgi:thiamine-phosphate diphosphorylase
VSTSLGGTAMGGTAIPTVLIVTDRQQCAPRELPELIDTAVEGGARAVLLREKDLPVAERRALAVELKGILDMVDGTLLVASDPTIESDGVHLSSTDPFPEERPGLLGRSCHSFEDVQAAAREGCDYVTLSPIFETLSKEGYGPPVGLTELRRVCEQISIPVLALGGVDAGSTAMCLEAGATGVAVMGAVMRARFASVVVERVHTAARPFERARTAAPVVTMVSLGRRKPRKADSP